MNLFTGSGISTAIRHYKQDLPTTPQLHRFQHHKFIIGGNGGAVAKNFLQFMEVIQVTVGNDIQLAVDFQAAARVVEHFPGNVIGQCMLLVKRRVAEHSIKAERLHAGERVVDHKLAAIQRLWHVGFNIQTAGSNRHR